MKEKIIELLQQEDYEPKTVDELAEVLQVSSSDDFKELVKTLVYLEDTSVIYRSKKDKYSLTSNLNFVRGLLKTHERGFGFVINEDGEDIFIREKDMNGAIDGDDVLVQVTKNALDKKREGFIVKIVERNFKKVIGLYREVKEVGYVKIDNKNVNVQVIINKINSLGAMDGHKVIVEIVNQINEKLFEGKIIKILGHLNDPGVDILSIVHKHEINEKFPEAVIKQAEDTAETISEQDLEGRRDLRNEVIVTIDGDDAKDLDDAVNVKLLDNGNYELGVHIADVSHYVTEGSPIDIEAYDRGTSVYLADRVIPMIPHRLSNGICSLNPQVDRLTLSCVMEIGASGKVVKYDIFQSVIKTTERMTYKNVNKILEDQDPETMERYKELVPMFKNMDKLAAILRHQRFERGSLDFDLPEAKIVVDETGKATDIILRERGTSEKIIEEFMLKANETVAENYFWMNVPFIYRIHDEPKENKIRQFFTFVNSLGYKIKGKLESIHPKALQGVLETVQDTEESSLLSTLLLRSMAKAVYSQECKGHYGLAAEYYTHFTSPIRRYPDLIVHRLIREYTIKGNIDPETLQKYELLMPDIGEQTSRTERRAVECEREVNDMKMAEYMESQIGQTFEGVISGVTGFGLFVELPNTIEGLVHIMDMRDDYYVYDERTLSLIGERSKKIYRIGDHVNVKCINASKENATIDFEIVGMKNRRRPKTDSKPRGKKETSGYRNKKDTKGPRNKKGVIPKRKPTKR